MVVEKTAAIPELRFVDVIGLAVSEGGEVSVDLQFTNFATKKFDTETIVRSELTMKKLQKMLRAHGVPDIDIELAYKWVNIRVNQILLASVNRNNHPIRLEHSALGWAVSSAALSFRADKIYTEDDIVDSEYVGTIDIKSSGFLEAFINMLKDVLKDNIPMQAVTAMGAASPVLPFANAMWGVQIGNPINHLVGTSSTGKTTAAELFVAFGSNPVGKNGLILTFLSTDNAILKQIAGIHGYPAAIDELSMGGRNTKTLVVYALGNGTSRARCTAGGSKVDDGESFEVVFLSTGESSLSRKCVKTEGITARLFEFPNVQWTRTAEESEKIKEVARANYGFVTPKIAQELLQNGENWKVVFIAWQLRIIERIKAEKLIIGVGDRVANIIALYMTSLEILDSLFNLNFDIEGVFEFFWLHVMIRLAEDSNLAIRAYDAIIRHFARYKNERYIDDLSARTMPFSDIYACQPDKEGIIVDAARPHVDVRGNVYGSYVIFYPDVLEKILEDNGFIEPKVVLRSLRKDKLLRVKDANRDYMSICLEGVETRVYAVWIRDYTYSGYDNTDEN